MVICNVLDLVDTHTKEEEVQSIKKVFNVVRRGKVQRQITQSNANKADKGQVQKYRGVSPREQTDIEHEGSCTESKSTSNTQNSQNTRTQDNLATRRVWSWSINTGHDCR